MTEKQSNEYQGLSVPGKKQKQYAVPKVIEQMLCQPYLTKSNLSAWPYLT